MRVTEICLVLEQVAPLHLAQDWDNVGLLAGDEEATCDQLLLCIDLTHAVLDEAIEVGCQMVMAYHPPLFRPISALRRGSRGTDAVMWRAIRANVAVFSMHTALDAAAGGTNDVLAELCGASELRPFEHTAAPQEQVKVVVFVPRDEVDTVADAMVGAGAGVIGDYTRCSFRTPGLGTFCGAQDSNPTVGAAGQYESVNEVRLEMVTKRQHLVDVVQALRRSHSYEEPAFDVYPLIVPPSPGIGRMGPLPQPVALGELARHLQQATQASHVQTVGVADTLVQRVAVCVGAAGNLPFSLGLGPGDCVVTGEMRHHDGLTVQRLGAAAIVLGHWASERPALPVLARLLTAELNGVAVHVSARDRDPFQA